MCRCLGARPSTTFARPRESRFGMGFCYLMVAATCLVDLLRIRKMDLLMAIGQPIWDAIDLSRTPLITWYGKHAH